MKTLYIDCGMGAAGDMLTAALLELLPSPADFIDELNSLGIPGVRYEAEPSVKCGITGTRVLVKVHGQEEGEHGHGHDCCHEHDGHNCDREHDCHHHSSLHDIHHIVSELDIPEKVKQDITEVYRLIAEAESRVHNKPVDEIHFHELGNMDAIADITAVCLLMHRLAPAKTVVSPVHVGSGRLHCAHGILPVPAPATALILQGVPIYGGSIKGELCTPTGAALLKHFADEFGAMPVMKLEAVGYGMGKKDFETANCVRCMLGETEDKGDVVYELSCNVDDMSAEYISFAMDRLFEAGAKEVYTGAVGMKKSRPGVLICALCHESARESVIAAMFRHTTTIGIRETTYTRHVMNRSIESVETPYGTVRRKNSEGFGVSRSKLEYDDLARIAREQSISLFEAKELIEK